MKGRALPPEARERSLLRRRRPVRRRDTGVLYPSASDASRAREPGEELCLQSDQHTPPCGRYLLGIRLGR